MPSVKALAPARIKWAIELLELETKHNVLEIGCGSGVAAQHICAKLGRGSYLGVDKSLAAINAARARNIANVNGGRAIFWHAPFNAEDREPALFDKVLAVNVNLFWADEAPPFLDVRRVMHPKSRFVQVYEPPNEAQRTKIANLARRRMPDYFSDVTIKRRTIGGAPLIAIVAGVTARKAV